MASEKENQGFKKSVSPEEQALRERVKEVMRDLGYESSEHGMKSSVARTVNAIPQKVDKWMATPGSTPDGYSLAAICKGAGVNFEWLLYGKGPKKTEPVVVKFPDKFMMLLRDFEEWARTLDDIDSITGHVKFELTKRYPEFGEWIKKRDNGGQKNGTD